jgi:hypothetical protein
LRKKRPAGDEGALYTSVVMAEVKRRRLTREPSWTAEQLAEAMAAEGVPWTRDTVVNLETGRRKRLAVHELIALAFVLKLDSPVDLLAPEGHHVPVTPQHLVSAAQIRAWCEQRIFPPSFSALPTFSAQIPAPEDIVRMVQAGDLTRDAIGDIVAFLQMHIDRGTFGDADGSD